VTAEIFPTSRKNAIIPVDNVALLKSEDIPIIEKYAATLANPNADTKISTDNLLYLIMIIINIHWYNKKPLNF
jgi:hypothetical protein